jgi:hypothetical protein
MLFSKYFRATTITIAALILFYRPAYSEPLKDKIGKLEVLQLSYGVNTLELSGKNTIIVRGRFENGNAWDGDIYTVLQKKDNVWRMVRHEKSARSSVLTETLPHTDEDSIDSVRFMIPKGSAASDSISDLYLLEASRKNDPDAIDTSVTFTVSVLQPEPDFGVLYFHELQKTHPKTKYCNADLALHQELGIPFPGDKSIYLVCTTWKKNKR